MDETLSVSVVDITTEGFVINVFRVDRDGPQWPDRGGRGWLKALEVDWLAWEPAVEDITVLQVQCVCVCVCVCVWVGECACMCVCVCVCV